MYPAYDPLTDPLYDGPPEGIFPGETMDIASIYDDIYEFEMVMHTVFYKKKPYHRRIRTFVCSQHTYPM